VLWEGVDVVYGVWWGKLPNRAVIGLSLGLYEGGCEEVEVGLELWGCGCDGSLLCTWVGLVFGLGGGYCCRLFLGLGFFGF